jgi:hypothetical protein
MRELFLPFHRIIPLVFHRGISTEPRVPHAPHRPFAIAPFSFCALQPFFAATVISSPITATR